MIKAKLFSTSRENDEFLAFLTKNTKMRVEESDEALEAYMNDWLAKNPKIKILQAGHPIWAGNHFIYLLLYEDKSS